MKSKGNHDYLSALFFSLIFGGMGVLKVSSYGMRDCRALVTASKDYNSPSLFSLRDTSTYHSAQVTVLALWYLLPGTCPSI